MNHSHRSMRNESGQSEEADVAASNTHNGPSIRAAHLGEIASMTALFEDEVRAGRMLPRDPAEVAAHIDDWLVAEEDGRIVGCVSLVFFNRDLCEVRSLAVHSNHRGNGLGGDLIRAAVNMARARGMRRVLTLTRSLGVFERAGFTRDLIANFPEKVWRDCTPCPFRERCDEITMIYHLDHLETPGSGNGHRDGHTGGHTPPAEPA